MTLRMPGDLLAVVAVGLLAGCGLERHSQARVLPCDCRAPVHYVALGDSTVEGVGASGPDLNYVSRLHARLRAKYPNARVSHLGVASPSAGDVIPAQLERAL